MIIWSPKARITYFQILDYLEQNWSPKEILNFTSRTEKVLELISTHPKLFHYSRSKDIFKCVLNRQISLFYRIRGENIELLLFWDARQDPKKLKI